MEKPFGTDLASAVALNAKLHECSRRPDLPHRSFPRQGAGAEHPRVPLRQRPVRADLEPQLHRSRADRRARDAGPRQALGFYEQTGAYRDMVVTHLFQILGFMAMEPPTRWSRRPSARRRTRSSAACCRSTRATWCAANTPATARRKASTRSRTPRPSSRSNAHRQLALGRRAVLPAHRQAAGRGQRIISIAFREPPKSMFPAGSGVGAQGPDHLTFDLADASKCRCRSTASARPRHAARQAEPAVRDARHRARSAMCSRPTSA
jgi:glucose-6-phosphate 1-dehydrogenase